MKILKFFAVLAILAGLILFIIVLVTYLKDENSKLTITATSSSEKFSSLGSLLSGIVGTLWSLGSILLFYIALSEQREDMKTNKKNLEVQTKALKQQVEEFRLQREELEETRKVYLEQAKTQSLQRFESTFFQMLNLHHTLVNSMILRDHGRKGRDCFETLYNFISKEYELIQTGDDADVITCYTTVFKDNQEALGHYFRNLYHILKFIKQSNVLDKKTYVGLVRAQLSHYELILLFYNGLSGYGIQKAKPLIEQFGLLKNLTWLDVMGGKDIIRKYKPSAYGEKNHRFLTATSDWR